MKKGLKQPWMGMLFAVLISITFGFAFNSVQSNTICAAAEHAFGFNHIILGGVLTLLTLLIIFGGIQRIARVSSIIVPVMALGYVGLALVIVALNITHLPGVIALIVSHAFGWEQALAGGVGMALMQGIKRGLFSNEAGMGSAPNAAATAHVSHPVKQGLIQTLAVFTDCGAAKNTVLGSADCILCDAAKVFDVTRHVLAPEPECLVTRERIEKERWADYI